MCKWQIQWQHNIENDKNLNEESPGRSCSSYLMKIATESSQTTRKIT